MPEIIFTDTTGLVPREYYPKPAKLIIPDWLKKLQPYMDSKDLKIYDGRETNQSIKKCVPVMDVVTLGYMIVLTEDISVQASENGPLFVWPEGMGISFHTRAQLGQETSGRPPTPKWNNPFGITTPPGYSTLFMPPSHANSVFNILPGVVDTDGYNTPVRFPFELIEPDWVGIVPAGTPIAQVVPFRRETWHMEMETSQTIEVQRNLRKVTSVFTNGYRSMFWKKKFYS